MSPREDDGWAEYRDGDFLERVGLSRLRAELRDFWPTRGPQWDALGVAGDTVLLVEAKAHVGELASNCAAVSASSRGRITASLAATRDALGARKDGDWLNGYYQLANRLAHLWLLRERGVDARLVLLQFTGKTGMPTASTRAAYDVAFRDALAHLGLGAMPAVPGVVNAYQEVAELA